MTGQRMWVRTFCGEAVAVDQIVRYGVAGLGDTGRAVLTVHTISDVAHHLGLFGSASQALDFARRHFGPVIDPADLTDTNEHEPTTADDVAPDAAFEEWGVAQLLAIVDARWRDGPEGA